MVAGGGASVIYADTVGDLGFAGELGNYAEYSGAPNAQARPLSRHSHLTCLESGVWKVVIRGFSAVRGLCLAKEPGKYTENCGVPMHRSTTTRSFLLCNQTM